MCASHWVAKPKGAMRVEVSSAGCRGTLWLARGAPRSHPRCIVSRVEIERTRWDPKDGELCLSRMKPEETLVEVRSDSDVQIDRRTWV